MSMMLRNWWCPRCRQWLASEDIAKYRHIVCGTKCQWRSFTLLVLATSEDPDTASTAELGS